MSGPNVAHVNNEYYVDITPDNNTPGNYENNLLDH